MEQLNTEPNDKKKEARAEQRRKLEMNLARVRHRWVVLSGKGGVGKSTVAANLAVALARRGEKVGLLDVDIHGPNAPKMLGVDGEMMYGSEAGMEPLRALGGVRVISTASMLPNPDTPIAWRGPLKMGIIRQFLADVHWGSLDHLVVDEPPGTGDEPMSIAQLLGRVDGAIVVTTPQKVALLDSRKSVVFARKMNMPLAGIIENMSGMTCPHCGHSIELFGEGGAEAAAAQLRAPFLGRIPFDPAVVRGGDEGRPPVLYEPQSPFAQVFSTIVEKLLSTCGATSDGSTDDTPAEEEDDHAR